MNRRIQGIRYGILSTALFLVLLPLVMIAGGMFMGNAELVERIGGVLGINRNRASWRAVPSYMTLKPVVELLLDSPKFFKMFWNSVRQTVPVLLGQQLIAVPAAWSLGRYSFRGKKAVRNLYILLMILPFQVTMVSSYLVLKNQGILDTSLAIILPAVFSTFPVFIMIKFFESIPEELMEAARMDGAGEIRIFTAIGIPLGKGGILSAMILSYLECWNAIEQPLTFLREKSLWPMSLYLPQITADRAGVAFAASAVMMIPAVLIFLWGEGYLEQGIVASGIKE
ncbi:MAG: carbohydrate ABC transporter permease [Lachnospiraceae bacterium]|nr:carbohydrate ABC transporter permease [Lachnospiraceae bacterium]